jgi:putative ABC transport system substrate-binding protein
MQRRDFLKAIASSAGAWPLRAAAQGQQRVYRIAVVHPVDPTADMNENGESPFYRSLFLEMHRLGYFEGKNIQVERRSGEGRTERYAEVARNLVDLRPDVIVVTGARILAYIREATQTIPIVAITGDPILFNIVSNLRRPGGNITGFSADASIEVHGKYLEILRDIKPTLSRVGFLAPRLAWEPYGRPLREAADRMGLTIVGPPLENPITEAEHRRVITEMVQTGVDALLVTAAAENYTHRRFIVRLVEENRLVAIYPFPEFTQVGGLIAYAVDFIEIGTRAAGYVDRILHGTNPGNLPYYMPTKLQLIINLKTAKAFGLELPPTLLARADEVIE